jgi:hypothetical protein
VGLLQAEAEEKTKGKTVEMEKATDDDQALADDDVLAGGTGADLAAVETRVESGPLVDDGEGEAALKEKGKLIDEEERNTGEVKSSVYLEYMRSTGGLGLLSLLVLSSLLFQVRTSGLPRSAPKELWHSCHSTHLGRLTWSCRERISLTKCGCRVGPTRVATRSSICRFIFPYVTRTRTHTHTHTHTHTLTGAQLALSAAFVLFA